MSRDESTFKEKVGNCLSYLMFFAFVAAAGGGGYWWYRHQASKNAVAAVTQITSENPPEIAPESIGKPSDLWKPVMDATLPPACQPLDEEILAIPRALDTAERLTDTNSLVPRPSQAAWKTAQVLGREIRSTYMERQQYANNLKPKETSPTPVRAAKTSASQLAEDEKRKVFFEQSLHKRWELLTVQKRKNVAAIYQKMLQQEARP